MKSSRNLRRYAQSILTLASLAGISALTTSRSTADIIFSEDFSAGDGGFQVTSDGDPTGPWIFNSGDGTWSVDGDGGLGTPTWNALTTPGIVVPAEIPIQITIVHRYSIEPQWDGTALAFSVNSDDQDSFTVLTGDQFVRNGYTYSGLLGNHILGEQQGGNGEGFNGNSPGYNDNEFITSVAQIPAVDLGDTLRVQMIGGWDEGATGTFPNWEIASIKVETLTDIDGDGMFDSYEDENGLDKNVDDSEGDLDGDTVTNLDEFTNGTDPQNADTDGDDLADNVETGTGIWVSVTNTGTNPLSTDSDGDTLTDDVETNTGTFVSAANTGTDPNKIDSDGDGFSDPLEINNGSDPTDEESLPAVPTYEVLDDLITGDLTDPEDDGDEAAGPDDPSWNWASIDSNNEPGFEGGEFAFNVFDNKKDAGGNDKWCCTGGTEDAPLQLTVEFELPVSLTHLTITSANDTPTRDPLDWKILGSNDGETFSPIYERAEELSLWQEFGDEFAPPRFTTIKVTLPTASPLFRYIRYEVTRSADGNHQIGELEYFGSIDTADTDGDGMPDAWEEVYGLIVGTNDGAEDADSDGLTNKQEFDKGTTPNKADTDSDGLNDGVETGTGIYVDGNDTGTDPLEADTDGDSLADGVETKTGAFVSATDTGTDPNKKDTDGDTFGDGQEIVAGSDPTDPNSKPEGGLLAAWDFEDSAD
ncbi:MAG: discoidin domain-containing protein, partial [Verrucomicrobiae bacterium]|nr:discoidin domain-containing protein [Verrucomicrobiae bacterium]